jgi:hypothetical protein
MSVKNVEQKEEVSSFDEHAVPGSDRGMRWSDCSDATPTAGGPIPNFKAAQGLHQRRCSEKGVASRCATRGFKVRYSRNGEDEIGHRTSTA